MNAYRRSFLFGTKLPTPQIKQSRKVQRLGVWAPEEGETVLFMYVIHSCCASPPVPETTMQNIFALACLSLASGLPWKLGNNIISLRTYNRTGITGCIGPYP